MQARTALKLLCCTSAGAAALLARLAYLRLSFLHGLRLASWGSSQLSAAVLLCLSVLGALAATWYCLSALLALVATANPRRPSLPQTAWGRDICERLLETWGTPVVRRIAAGALVASLGAAPAMAAEAPSTDDFGWQPTQSTSQAASPAPGTLPTPEGDSPGPADAPPPGAIATNPPEATAPSPEAPASNVAPPNPTATPPARQGSTPAPTHLSKSNQHTVLPGESLWTITATELGLPNDSADVAKAWPQLYEANQEVIGPEPGLILPGTTLALPWASN